MVKTVITVAQRISLAKYEDQTMLIPTGCGPKSIWATKKKK
jgi:hypothetical protein